MARTVSFTLGQFTMTWTGDDPYADGVLSSSSALPPHGEDPAPEGLAAAGAFQAFAAAPYYTAHGGAQPWGTRTFVGLLVWLGRFVELTGYKPTIEGDLALVEQTDAGTYPASDEERDRIY